jgi:hypothetical protein
MIAAPLLYNWFTGTVGVSLVDTLSPDVSLAYCCKWER